jgi:hypothetical protein
MKKLFALLPILIIVAASCRPKGGMDADAGYFSITALRDSLIKGKPVYNFQKTLVVDGKEETQLITDSLHSQIAFFEHFEINKPSYRDAYTLVEDTSGRPVKYTAYYLKPDFKYPIKEFHVSYENGKLSIAALSVEKNLLTTTTKELNVTTYSKVFVSYTYSVLEELKGGSPSSTKIVLGHIK